MRIFYVVPNYQIEQARLIKDNDKDGAANTHVIGLNTHMYNL
jgi:hypothetical protein